MVVGGRQVLHVLATVLAIAGLVEEQDLDLPGALWQVGGQRVQKQPALFLVVEHFKSPVVFVGRVEVAHDLAVPAQVDWQTFEMLTCGPAVDPPDAHGQDLDRHRVAFVQNDVRGLDAAHRCHDVIAERHELGHELDRAVFVLEVDDVRHRIATTTRPLAQLFGEGFEIGRDRGGPQLAVGFADEQHLVAPHPVNRGSRHLDRTAQARFHQRCGFAGPDRSLDAADIRIRPIERFSDGARKSDLFDIWQIASREIAL